MYIISAFASPFFGFVIDKTGKNVLWVFMSICTTIGAHSILAYTMLNPYIGVVIKFFDFLICLILIQFNFRVLWECHMQC